MSVETSTYRLQVDARAFEAHAKDMERYTRQSADGVEGIEKSIGRLPRAVDRTAGRMSEAWKYTRAGAKAASVFAQEMHGVETATGGAADEAGRLERATNGAKNWLGGLLAAGGATAAATYLYGLGDAAQTARTSFTTLLGSTEAADDMLKEMASFAASTPFELAGLKDNVRFMLAMGFEAEQALPLLAQIGDAVSSLGGGEAEIQRVVRALGQMQQKGKVSAEELNQLAEVGIGGWKYLADEFGQSIGEVQAAAEDGALDVNRAVQAIARGMGTEFAGGMANLSETASGALSTVRDVATQTLTALTAGAFDEFTADLRAIRDSVDGVETAASGAGLQQWSERIAYAYRVAREFVTILVSWLPVIAKVGGAVVVFQTLAAVVGTASRVMVGFRVASLAGAAAQTAFNSSLLSGAARMTAFNAVVKANPVGLLITVLAGAVTALAAFRAASQRSATAIREENEALQNKIDLLRAMPGAELYAKTSGAKWDAVDAQSEYDRLQKEKASIRGRSYQDEVTTEFGPDGRTSYTVTAEQQRARDLSAVNAEIVTAGRNLRGALQTVSAIQQESGRDLDTRLGYLQAEFDQITASTRMTAEQRDRAAELRSEMVGINRTLEQRRAADRPPAPSGAGGAGPGGETDKQRDARLRREGNERQREVDAAAQTAEETLQLGEVVTEARRQSASDLSAYEIALEQERLRQARAASEARLALITDEGARARTAFDIAAYYDAEQARLAVAAVDAEEAARVEAVDADLAREKRRITATVKDAGQRAAALQAAEATAEAKRTEAVQDGTLARERIETERQQAQRERMQGLTKAFAEEAEKRAEIVKRFQEQEMRPPDVGATLAREAVGELEADIERARARLAAGLIDEAAFAEEVEALKAHARKTARAIADEMIRLGLVTKDAADEIVGLVNAGGDDLSFQRALDDLDAMTGLADDLSRTFAVLGSDLLADVTRGLGDVTDAVRRAREVSKQRQSGAQGFTGLAGSLAGLGSIVGVVGALSGAIGAVGSVKDALFGNAEQTARNRAALADAAAATEANTAALLSGEVGADLTADQVGAYDAGRGEVERRVGEMFDGVFGTTRGYSEAGDAFEALFRDLEAQGLDVGDFRDQLATADTLSDSEQREAYRALLAAMDQRFEGLADGLGTYTADLAGATAQLTDDLQRGGRSAAEALARFVATLEGSDMGPAIGAFLASLEALEPGTDAYQDAIAAFFRSVQDGDVSLPSDMSRDEFEALIDALSGIGGGESPTGNEAEPDRSNATSITSATFAQVDVTNGYLQEILRTVRAWFAAWTGSSGGAASGPVTAPGPRAYVGSSAEAASAPAQAADGEAASPTTAASTPPEIASAAEITASINAQTARLSADLAAIHGVLAAASQPAPGVTREDLERLTPPSGGNTYNVNAPVSLERRFDAEAEADAILRALRPKLVRELRGADRVIYGRTA